jgi:hypothetical protein
MRLMFGWFGKAKWDQLQRHLAEAQESQRQLSELLHQAAEQCRTLQVQLGETIKELEKCDAERRLLLDRALQLGGQPPLYAKPEPVIPRPADPTSTLPPPPVRASFDDVHKAARQAIKDGTYKLRGVVN